ncbi:hypothetical protein A5634_16725 [Mycobacterium asiaticum]|uniref:Uncharacterized protein n=1 Tax=Mycobacterium asiaticum TaxID=1790 RepID=A0A1A3P7P6_MYCAS|nr:hypothetical protein A5634_16725 [Mycobacterium asiaticum]
MSFDRLRSCGRSDGDGHRDGQRREAHDRESDDGVADQQPPQPGTTRTGRVDVFVELFAVLVVELVAVLPQAVGVDRQDVVLTGLRIRQLVVSGAGLAEVTGGDERGRVRRHLRGHRRVADQPLMGMRVMRQALIGHRRVDGRGRTAAGPAT